jgi:hypothetical protein
MASLMDHLVLFNASADSINNSGVRRAHIVARVNVLVLVHRPVQRKVDHTEFLSLVHVKGSRKCHHHQCQHLSAGYTMFGRIRGKPGDGPGLIVVLEECRCPCVGPADYALRSCDGSFELWKLPIVRRRLEFIRSLSNINDILSDY